jgi:hypothetical protein
MINFLLHVKTENRSAFQIIFWWEIRRILYNIIVISVICSAQWAICSFINLGDGEDAIEPLAVIAFWLLANIGYTLGWITELSMPKSIAYAPRMFKIGVFISVFPFVFAIVFHFLGWIFNGFTPVESDMPRREEACLQNIKTKNTFVLPTKTTSKQLISL